SDAWRRYRARGDRLLFHSPIPIRRHSHLRDAAVVPLNLDVDVAGVLAEAEEGAAVALRGERVLNGDLAHLSHALAVLVVRDRDRRSGRIAIARRAVAVQI